MTIKTLKDQIEKFIAKHPNMLDSNLVVDGTCLTVGDFDEDTETWNIGPTVALLPENTRAQY